MKQFGVDAFPPVVHGVWLLPIENPAKRIKMKGEKCFNVFIKYCIR
jgi:hypothetical protein